MFKTFSLLSLIALSAAPLMGQTAQEIADNLSLPSQVTGNSRLPLPEVPGDVTIRLGGADFEQIIRADGTIAPVISDVPVHVFFQVKKDDQTVNSKDYQVVVKASDAAEEGANPKPATIPAILQWKGSQGEWKPGDVIRVAGPDKCHVQDFIRELCGMFPSAKVQRVSPKEKADIYLRLQKSEKPGLQESYKMKITPEEIHISGESPCGVFWGTRSLLQILSSQGSVPAGQAVDFPRYSIRGCMLDIARAPYSLKDLHDVVDLMAWYKMNDLHLCINNNYIFHENYVDAGRDPFKESYAAFRLESKMKGKDGTPLTAQDLSYSKADFRALIDYARARGVNIVPEFDTPGHALSFTRVRPDLVYKGPMSREKRRCEMLDAANPETLKFVCKVFDEYLLKDKNLNRPVFENCVVHIGADEFFGAVEDYRKYTDGLLKHVLNRGYTPRVWGSLKAKRGKTPVVSKGVQMNLWSADWMTPKEAIEQGYDVINTHDRALYIVPFANYYRMDRNHKGIYNNWIPNKIGAELLPAGHPQLLGAAFAVWNDMSGPRHRGYGLIDIWASLAGSMDVLCGKLWGEQQRSITFEQHRDLVKKIGQGPSQAEPSDHPTLTVTTPSNKLPLALRHAPIRPPYHLTLHDVKLNKAVPGQEQALLSGPEGVLLGVMKDGSIGFRRADGMEFSWDAKLPVDQKVKLELIATVGKTRLLINGQEIDKMTLNNYSSIDEAFGKRTRDIISSFTLPLDSLGESFQGSVSSLQVERN